MCRRIHKVLHVQVGQLQVTLPELSVVVHVRGGGRLEQVERLVTAPVFERHLAQRVVDLVEIVDVLFVLQHVFQQFHNGLAVAVPAVEGHGLLDVPLEDPFVIRPSHVCDFLELLDGAFFIAGFTQALGKHKRDARSGGFLFLQQRQCVFKVSRGRVVLFVQDVVLRQHHQRVGFGVVGSVANPFGFGEGVFGLHLIPGSHVGSAQPGVCPSFRIGAIHRAHEVGENLLCLVVLAFEVIRLADHCVVVVDPLVHDGPIERLRHALGGSHGVAVDDARALFNGPLHQREDLLGRGFIRFQKQREHLVPALLVDFLELEVSLTVRFVGVVEPVVFGRGVVEQPVRPAVSFGRARHPRERHKGQKQNQGAVQHRVVQRMSVKFIGCGAWMGDKLCRVAIFAPCRSGNIASKSQSLTRVHTLKSVCSGERRGNGRRG